MYFMCHGAFVEVKDYWWVGVNSLLLGPKNHIHIIRHDMISLPNEQSHVPMKLKFKCSRQGVKGIEAWIWIEFHREE